MLTSRVAAPIADRSSLTPLLLPLNLDVRLVPQFSPLACSPRHQNCTQPPRRHRGFDLPCSGLCTRKRGFAMDLSLQPDQYPATPPTQPHRSRATDETEHSPSPRLLSRDRRSVRLYPLCSYVFLTTVAKSIARHGVSPFYM